MRTVERLPVCIAGMHRSGTSLMARLLNLSGLYLGRDQDMLPAGPTNPDGHWEHEGIVQVNEELLADLGGGWDLPPDLAGLADRPRMARFEAMARPHLARFAGHDPWGWKDPRSCLTLPFWRPLVGSMHVVFCVRHPLEVALSLRMRNGSTIAFGLALWTAYNEALLRTTSPAERVVTHYQRYMMDPVAEVSRVGARWGLGLSDVQRAEVRQFVSSDRRHSQFSFADLMSVGVSPRVARLYRDLSIEAEAPAEAGMGDASAVGEPPSRRDEPLAARDALGYFDYDAMERLRRRS